MDTSKEECPEKTLPDYDRISELKAFEETKAGVKGLVDSGITKIPRIFHVPISNENYSGSIKASTDHQLNIPTIDLGGLSGSDPIRRKVIIEQVREASENWGFFQVVNHGVPPSVLEEMKNGVRRFFEQDDEKKKEFYTRDYTRRVVYHSNSTLFKSEVANWRDTIFATMAPHPPKPQELPEACRNEMILYAEEMMKLGMSLFGLLSEALGLDSSHLKDMECAEGLVLVNHYYPVCPEPELAIGISKHADTNFLTVLLQDHIGGLQVLHENQWLDVPPMPGALIVNIGDLLQLITNDKFKSLEHRVLANRRGPRISVAAFFSTLQGSSRLYGPINELLSEDNPAIYRETTVREYLMRSSTHGVSAQNLQWFRL